MAKKKRKQGQSGARKAAKRQRRSAGSSIARLPTSRSAWLKKAGAWPVHEAAVSSNWTDESQLAVVVVARRSAGGSIAAGLFLMDLCCLGAKNAFAEVFSSESEYERRFRSRFFTDQPMTPINIDLAAKIVRTGVRYARELGFQPNPGYKSARLLLEGSEQERCGEDVPVGGPEGKPLYVAGPDDDVRRIMTHLRAKLGSDGFHFIAPPEELDGL